MRVLHNLWLRMIWIYFMISLNLTTDTRKISINTSINFIGTYCLVELHSKMSFKSRYWINSLTFSICSSLGPRENKIFSKSVQRFKMMRVLVWWLKFWCVSLISWKYNHWLGINLPERLPSPYCRNNVTSSIQCSNQSKTTKKNRVKSIWMELRSEQTSSSFVFKF